MHRALPALIIALTSTGVVPARAGEATSPGVKTDATVDMQMNRLVDELNLPALLDNNGAGARLSLLVGMHADLLAMEQTVSECERRGFAEAGPARSALERLRAKYAARADEMRRAFDSPEAHEWREQALAQLRDDAGRDRERPAKEMRRACRDIVTAAASLDRERTENFEFIHALAPQTDPTAGIQAAPNRPDTLQP